MICFSSLVSSISASLTSLRMQKRAQATMKATLREFLREASVYPPTAIRIEKEVMERLRYHKQPSFEDVEAFRLLSSPSLSALRLEVF